MKSDLLQMPADDFIEFKLAEVEQSVPSCFEQQVALHPNRIALKTATETLTYATLNQAANRLARAIVACTGPGAETVAATETVAFILEQGVLPVIAILGILKAGKTFVPLDPANPPEKLKDFLINSEARLLLTSHQKLDLARQAAGDALLILNIEALETNLGIDNLGLSIPPEAIAGIFYTSGSTGTPKGVMLSHRYILHFAMISINAYRITAADHQSLPFSTGFAWSLPCIFGSLLRGATVYPVDLRTMSLADIVDWLIREEITILQLLTSVLRQVIETVPQADESRFLQLRMIVFAGEALANQKVEKWRRCFTPDCVLAHAFASTEACLMALYFVRPETRLGAGNLPVGFSTTENQILILDADGNPMPTGETGEIAVRSRYLASGYWRDPELTRAKFLLQGEDERIYLSGDLGRLRSDGCLEYLGRRDAQVKIRGYRIELFEIEMALLGLGGVKEAVVLAHPNQTGEQRLVAYVVPRQFPPPTIRELRLRLAEQLPDYKVPALFLFLEALPKLPNGKLARLALPIPGNARPDLTQDFVPPRDGLELQLAGIWEEVLDIRPVGIHDDFLELGGHSLAAAQIIARMIQVAGVDLPVEAFFETPTVAQIAQRLAPSGESGHLPGPIVAPPPITPASREAYRAKSNPGRKG